MKFVRWSTEPLSIPFNRPIPISENTITHKKGIYLKLYDQNDHFGVGELAPLPSYHPWTLREELNDLPMAMEKILNKALDFNQLNWAKPGFGLIQFPFCSKSRFLTYTIELALIDYFFNFKAELLKKLSCPLVLGPTIQMNKLWHLAREGPPLCKEGDIIKIKIGRASLKEEITKIKNLLHHCPKIKIRFDSNALASTQLEEYFTSIPEDNIEYFEDPYLDHGLYQSTRLPFALDVQFGQYIDDRGVLIPNEVLRKAKAVVVKPSLVGGLGLSLSLIQQLKKSYPHIKAVISSSYETESALGYSLALSHFSNTTLNSAAHGLDTLRFFKSF